MTRILHEPFGDIELAHSVGLNATTYKYSGMEVDDETALINFGARYYDPTQARFISADNQLPGKGTTPQSFGRYSYALDNPIKYRDPTGHEPTLITAGIGAVIGAVVGAGIEAFKQAYNGEWNPDEIWASALEGGTVGFFGGLTLGGSLLADVAFSGINTLLGAMAKNAYLGNTMTVDEMLYTATIGAVTGGAFSGFGKGIGTVLKGLADDAKSAVSTGATDFLHGTTSEYASAILDGKLKPVSMNTNPFPQGSFFTFAADEKDAIIGASHWPLVSGKAASSGVGVVKMSLPNDVLDDLIAKQWVKSGQVAGSTDSPTRPYSFPKPCQH